MVLSGLATQEMTDLRVIVADQSDNPVSAVPVVKTLGRIIQARGGRVEWHHRPSLKGIAEQRDFLLSCSTAPAVLYLDDDVFMESWVVGRLWEVLRAQKCAFVGAFPNGMSHFDDVRPDQQVLDFWDGPVKPESVEPGSPAWERWNLHRAANLYHASRQIPPGEFRLYKVAWIASCILYDREMLTGVGGFSFWHRLPRWQSGEEVLVQNVLMRLYGGCAIMPSGTYYAEIPSTTLNERGSVDGHALSLLAEMVDRYAPAAARPEIERA